MLVKGTVTVLPPVGEEQKGEPEIVPVVIVAVEYCTVEPVFPVLTEIVLGFVPEVSITSKERRRRSVELQTCVEANTSVAVFEPTVLNAVP